MEITEVLLAGVILLSIIILIRYIALKHGIRDLNREFKNRSTLNSNTKIGVSCRDADLRALTAEINRSLAHLREQYHRYEQGNDENRRVITNVTHDLRTPLTAICGYLDLLKNAEELSEEERNRYLGIIENRALYMKDLTEELFVFTKSAGSDLSEQPDMEEVLLNQALEDCIMDYYAALTEKKIELTVNITEQHIKCSANKKAIDRVLSNLMSNCLKYSKGDLEISLSEDGEICFRNYAPLVTQLDAERLFDRYYTVETGAMASGIGLSIAKMLVTQMNGTISAQKEEDYLAIRIRFQC